MSTSQTPNGVRSKAPDRKTPVRRRTHPGALRRSTLSKNAAFPVKDVLIASSLGRSMRPDHYGLELKAYVGTYRPNHGSTSDLREFCQAPAAVHLQGSGMLSAPTKCNATCERLTSLADGTTYPFQFALCATWERQRIASICDDAIVPTESLLQSAFPRTLVDGATERNFNRQNAKHSRKRATSCSRSSCPAKSASGGPRRRWRRWHETLGKPRRGRRSRVALRTSAMPCIHGPDVCPRRYPSPSALATTKCC